MAQSRAARGSFPRRQLRASINKITAQKGEKYGQDSLLSWQPGLAPRYGGVKQIERLGPDGEILMEYAIYDAIRAGFNRIVLIIKPEIYNDVRELFGNRIEESTGIKIDYAFQTLDRFTESRPEFKARTKPFGTATPSYARQTA